MMIAAASVSEYFKLVVDEVEKIRKERDALLVVVSAARRRRNYRAAYMAGASGDPELQRFWILYNEAEFAEDMALDELERE